MTPYILYGGTFTRALAPQMVLEEGGLPYELRVMDMAGGEHRSPDFLKLNPAGYVPALVTPEGEILHEAAGIMLYLADRHGLSDLIPATDDPARGVLLSKLFYFTNDVQPSYKRFFYFHRYTPEGGDPEAIRAQSRAMVVERLGVLDAWLQERGPWHLGDRFSLADIHLAMWAAYGLDTSRDTIEMFPGVRRVFEGVMARPKCGPLLRDLVDLIDERRAGGNRS